MNMSNLKIPLKKLHENSIKSYLKKEAFDCKKLKKVSYMKKLYNERKLKALTENLNEEIKPLQNKWSNDFEDYEDYIDDPEIALLKQKLVLFLEKIDNSQLLFDQPFLSFFIEKGYLHVAEKFIFQAQKEDSILENKEIFQALRNAWIMNSLQLYWNLPLTLTPSIYSYSMLYPYTDNYLDNQEVNPLDKIQFNSKLERALAGEHQTTIQPEEKRVFALINQIEQQYKRKSNSKIYESIQLIHDAQVKSMQQGYLHALSNRELLNLSFYKGGTSVLADAFLVKPDLTNDEMHFSYQYGTFLQLLDDLQDIEEDQETNHQTLFSTEEHAFEIQAKIESLIAYIFRVNAIHSEDTSNKKTMKEVIRTCTLLMVMEAVGSNPGIVTPSFYSKLENYSKVRLSFFSEYKKNISQLFNDI